MRADRDDKHLATSTTEPEPNYEGGARKYPPAADDGSEAFDQRAASNKRRVPYGLTEPLGETPEATARSENVDPNLTPGEQSLPANEAQRRHAERK